MAITLLSPSVLNSIRELDTCTVSNAIERLHGRLRNEGSVSGRSVCCIFPDLPPILGYAATGRLRSTMVPVKGRGFHENMSWWRYVASLPEPRIIVLEDDDPDAAPGALFGDVHAHIAVALKCSGYVTDGSVRDLPGVKNLGFSLFARSTSVSHKYAHVAHFGRPVEVGGVRICPGDLVHGDRHGVHTIPHSIANGVPEMAARIRQEESELKSFCRSARFSLDGLEDMLRKLPSDGYELPVG